MQMDVSSIHMCIAREKKRDRQTGREREREAAQFQCDLVGSICATYNFGNDMSSLTVHLKWQNI